jgi:hypothetical protein
MKAWTMRWWALAWGLALLGACGGGTDTTKAHLRLVNASGGYSALDMSINNTSLQTSVAYGATASYADADPNNMATVISLPGSASALVSLTPAVSKDQYYSVLAYGNAGSLQALVLDNNTGAPDSGKALLRVVNAAPDAGNVDVYLTSSGDTLADAVALQAGASLGSTGAYAPINSGTWQLWVTGAGNKADLRLAVSGLSLGNQSVSTLVVTPGRGGVLVNALLLVDRGGITRADATQARVRVAAGVSSGGAVIASVGGTTVMNGTAAPAIGAYYTVAAGTPAMAVTVNGATAGASTATLAAGGDYTLLVYGPASAPLVSVIEDDNHRPSDTTTAKLRLVHGVADLSTTLALKSNFVPIADGVLPGSASAYGSASPSTTATLTVTAGGQTAPVCNLTTQTLVANTIYSLFALDLAATGTCVLIPDRPAP